MIIGLSAENVVKAWRAAELARAEAEADIMKRSLDFELQRIKSQERVEVVRAASKARVSAVRSVIGKKELQGP